MISDQHSSYHNDANGDVATLSSAVSINEVRAQWHRFLESYSEKMGLQYALHPAAPGELQGNVLRLCVENERQRQLIEQYREDITSSIQSFFKQPLIVEGVIGAPPVPKSNGNGLGQSSSASVNGTTRDCSDHPFVQGLVELLGAVKI